MKHAHESWVSLAVFEDETDARALRTLLQNNGFESRAYDDRFLRLFLFLRPPRLTYRTQVRKSDFNSAQEFISTEPSAALILRRAFQCPSCASLNIQYPQMTRKFFTPTVFLHAGVLLRLIDHEAYCEDCHCVWHLPEHHAVAVEDAAVSPQHH